MNSALLVIPVAHLASINALGAGMGWGGGNYTIPLTDTDDPAQPLTHMGSRVDVTGDFIALMDAAKAGHLPDLDYISLGVTPEEVRDAVTALIVDVADKPPMHHVPFALAARDMSRTRPVNLNTDPAERLQFLPGIGAAYASAIVAERPFDSLANVADRVDGIGPETVERWGAMATAGPVV